MNILYAETIVHKCAKLHEPRAREAQQIWAASVDEMLS